VIRTGWHMFDRSNSEMGSPLPHSWCRGQLIMEDTMSLIVKTYSLVIPLLGMLLVTAGCQSAPYSSKGTKSHTVNVGPKIEPLQINAGRGMRFAGSTSDLSRSRWCSQNRMRFRSRVVADSKPSIKRSFQPSWLRMLPLASVSRSWESTIIKYAWTKIFQAQKSIGMRASGSWDGERETLSLGSNLRISPRSSLAAPIQGLFIEGGSEPLPPSPFLNSIMLGDPLGGENDSSEQTRSPSWGFEHNRADRRHQPIVF